MIRRLLSQKAAVPAVLMATEAEKHLALSGGEITKLHIVAKVLGPLAEATTHLCKERLSLLSIVEPTLAALLERHLVVNDDRMMAGKATALHN